jgi:large subunit ribosomal protein L20
MPRVRRGFKTRRRHKKTLKEAKGYWGARSRLYRTATEAVDRALKYAYRDRRTRKREMRKLWIIRINAAARMNDITYREMIAGLKTAQVDINRKMLADLAVKDPKGFSHLAEIARTSLTS